MFIYKEHKAANVLLSILGPLIIETPFKYQKVILAVPTDVLRGIALNMISHRVHLHSHSTLDLSHRYTLEKVLSSLGILFDDNMSGFFVVKEL
jgi:hypothetical protein